MSTRHASIEIEYRGSLPYRIAGTLALLADAAHFDGFDRQIYVLHASLAPELRKDIELIYGPLGKRVIFQHLWRNAPEDDDLASFVSWVTQIGSDALCESISEALHSFASEEAFRTGANVSGPSAYDEEHLREFLQDMDYPWGETARTDPETFDRILRLLLDPDELKARLVFILTLFWGTHYKEIHEECTPIVERSLRYHENRHPVGDVSSIIESITGRRVSDELEANLAAVRRIVFVPSCHTGLSVSPIALDREFETILLQYNCRTSGGGNEALAAIARDIYPMVRALSDENRLLILQLLRSGELYAQQIVDRLDLSQSSVSRHLNLLVTGGVLSFRWEGGMKFYRINEDAIDRLTRGLSELTRNEEGGEPLR